MNERHKFVLEYLRKKFTFHLSDKNERICLFDKCILNTVEEAFKKAEKWDESISTLKSPYQVICLNLEQSEKENKEIKEKLKKQEKEFYDLLDEIENLINKFYKS